jgi:hypothetical protein
MLPRVGRRYILAGLAVVLAACSPSAARDTAQPAAAPEYWIEVQNTLSEPITISADVGLSSIVALGEVAAGATQRFRINEPQAERIRVIARRANDTDITQQVELRAGQTVQVRIGTS